MDIPVSVRFPTGTDVRDASPEDVARIAELYTDLDAHDLQPLWTQNRQLLGRQPRPEAIPYMWRRADLWPLAERCEELITISRGGDRRVLALANPGLGGKPFVSSTLWAAIQYLGPRESAPAHRHTPGAIRFVVEGQGTHTTVNGDACDMQAGDLILTPPWHWHDHQNDSDRPMVWFDGLDLPLVSHLNAIFFEPYPRDELQPVRGHNISEGLYAGPGVLPATSGAAATGSSPLLVYRYASTDTALEAAGRETDDPMVSIEYVNPVSGASVMPTIGCHAHRIRPGRRTPTARHVGSTVYVVFRGAGSSVIDGVRFRWRAGDIFVVPSWAAVDHEASEPSDLFSVTDRPVLEALGLYQHRVEDRQQRVSREFEEGRVDVATA